MALRAGPTINVSQRGISVGLIGRVEGDNSGSIRIFDKRDKDRKLASTVLKKSIETIFLDSLITPSNVRAHGVVGYHARLACERCWVQFPMCPVNFWFLVVILLVAQRSTLLYICSKELVGITLNINGLDIIVFTVHIYYSILFLLAAIHVESFLSF